jgi:PAS domain S-box-containing protein
MAIPVIGLIINAGIKQQKEAITVAGRDTQKLANSIAYEQQSKTASARQLMVALSQMPEVKQKDSAKVTLLLSEILKLNPDISNIFISDRSGIVWATAVPVKPPFIISDRRYFKNALASGKLSSGEYVVSRAINRPTFNFSYPIKDEQGNATGVISVGFLLEKYTQFLERSILPKNASFALVDHKGVIIFRALEPEKYIGKQTDDALFKEILAGPDEITAFSVSVASGDKRIVTTRKLRLDGESTPYMYIRAGIPVESALADANSLLLKNLIFLSGIFVMALFFSSYIGKRSIATRIEALEKASQSLANGDLKVKVSEIVSGGELGRLALSFDSMAQKLDLREQVLFETQERLRSFIANAPVILFVFDTHGILTFSDGKGLGLLGLNPGQVVGVSAFDLYKDSPSALEGIRRALTGDNFSMETTVGDKVFEVWYNPLKNSHGEFTGTIGVATDISGRKRAENTARENEYRYKTLFDSANDGIFLQDATGFLDCNQRGADMYGLPREKVIGNSPVNFAPERQPCGRLSSEVAEEMIQLVYNDKPQLFEWRSLRADGTQFDVEMTLSRLELSGSACLQAIVRDISERKRMEEARLDLEKQLLQAQKLESLGVLAGGIAHDFNNILMAIIGNADLALMRINKESPATDNLHNIEKAAARAADLSKQMLAYSGKGKFVVENIDFNHLLEDMLHMLEVSISKKAVLRLNLYKQLPAVEADATQIRQIVMNLVINASEAIGDKSGVIAITTGCMDCDKSYIKNVWLDENINEGLYIYLEIADTGCGMNKDTLAKIFDPFFTTKFTGRGLGMAAVLGIVRGHKGAIKVYSEVNKGTTFKILLPASDKRVECFNANYQNDVWKGTGKVLLVDDEETVRGIGSEMLKELGFSPITANDGREAVNIYKVTPDIDFVILDLTMPHMDGEQCFRELHQIKPDVKIIMSSGFNEQEVSQKFVGKGLAGFIQKPYKLSVLKEAIIKLG